LGLKFNEDKIRKHSSEISTAITRLYELSEMPKRDFLSDPHKIASAKYFLIVSIKAPIDMCNHVISKNRLRTPDDYADTFRAMGEEGAFSKEFVEKFVEMARFRNKIVHIYWAVDEEIIYEIIQDDIDDIEEFIDRFAKFLK